MSQRIVSKSRFIVALVAHTVSIDDKFFEYANKWLHSETLTTILCCLYNLDGPTSFMEIELNYALARREERYQNAFGIGGINQPFHENTCNIFKYEYKQDDGTRQYFYYIKSNVTKGGVPTWSSYVKHTPKSSLQGRQISRRHISRKQSSDEISDNQISLLSPPSLQSRRSSRRCIPRNRSSDEISDDQIIPVGKRAKVNHDIEDGHNITQPIVNAQWFKERMAYHENVVSKVATSGPHKGSYKDGISEELKDMQRNLLE